MKVTVCFGPVRVVVPCGDGYITVADLIRQATLRYKKATGKSADSWVAVQSLQTSDGGILDPDDRLNDVADDREQIVATFSDGDGPLHGGGDGASGSSIGTGSPDIFQNEGKFYPQPLDIEVTNDQVVANALQVRRGSEPALNQLEGSNGVSGSEPCPPITNSTSKRWSAAPIILDVDDSKDNSKNEKSKINGYNQSDWICHEEDEKLLSPASKFQRDGSNRLSMQFLSDEIGLKWMERAYHGKGGSARSSHSSLQRDCKRREPVGQANSSNSLPLKNCDYVIEEGNVEDLSTEFIVLRNEGGPLGIHVVPDYDNEGRDRGLLVQGIEPGGRVHKDGRLAVFDRIVEINGSKLLNEPFQKVQEIFKNSLSSGELRLRVIKHKSLIPPPSLVKQPPPPIYPIENSIGENMVEGHQRTINCSAKVATVSPTKKLLAGATAANLLQTANTRKMGRRIDLELLKGPAGLGFSITTRDNPAGGKCPIYIKNILPKGAAVDDGRLRPGDRLLQVNDIEMTGKTQAEAVAILRQVPPGSVVKISVSRQEDFTYKEEYFDEKECKYSKQEGGESLEKSVDLNDDPDKHSEDGIRFESTDSLSRKIQKPPRNLDESQIFPWRHREILTFDIPVHDSEKAGLGVSVKGKTSANHSTSNLNSSNQCVDLGIFVKSVLNGGAASRDGRLKTNDQLLNVNGKSLLNQSNANAMETLRRAMLYMEGPKPGVITLTIARRVSSPGAKDGFEYTSSSGIDVSRTDSNGLTSDHSIGSEASDSTVIFLPSYDNGFKSPGVSESQQCTESQKSQKFSSRNPVIDRLTGHHLSVPNNNALRNESYYRATHDNTWNISSMVIPNNVNKLNSPTVNNMAVEPVVIEEDYQTCPNSVVTRDSNRRLQDNYKNIDNSAMGSGQSISTQGDVTYASQLSLDENAAGFSRDGIGRQSMSEKRHATLDAKNTDTYRRNKKMREERQQNAQVEQIKQNKISHKIDEIRQELLEPGRARIRSGSADSMAMSITDFDRIGNEPRGRLDVGPALGMKKSSSLESLQTMVQEVQMAEDPDPAYTYRNAQGAVRVIRGRGCNESFRAAVDRSYDAPLGLGNQMDTPVSEEEAYIGNNDFDGHGILGRGTPRQSSMNAMRDSKLKHHKKKASLLKGIGSMFRFGKHRKPVDSEYTVGMDEEDEEGEEPKRNENEDKQREDARLAAQEEHEKIQEQYRKLILKQHQENQIKNDSVSNNCGYSNHKHLGRDEDRSTKNVYSWRSLDINDPHKEVKENNNRNSYFISSQRTFEGESNRIIDKDSRTRNRSYDLSKEREIEKQRKFSLDNRNFEENKEDVLEKGTSEQNRSERIHQLRAKHQKKHVERRGQYPSEEREEKFERAVLQKLDDQKAHCRLDSYAIYGEMGRPGSRSGITDPARFSHYVNYEEIQQHLNRKKQHYHSQRRDTRDLHQRPVSNFYEYESIQSVIRAQPSSQIYGTAKRSQQKWQNSDSLPRRFENDWGKVNASSLPRRIDAEEFSCSPSVKKTVNYLNKLSSSDSAPAGNFYCARTKKEDVRNNVTAIKTRGPYISQITIKENPDES